MKASKKSLLASGVALLASAALLAGTTFAWFTDSVVNTGNKIQAGNLAIGAYAYDLAEDGEGGFTIAGVNGGNPFKFETDGQNLKTDKNPIISEELFEPGKSNAKLLKVENEGTLAAKIKLDFTVEDGGLMEALWFDFVKVENGEVKGNFTRRPMNTLETFADNLELPLLENGDNVQFILIYGMDENAGNAFKDKSFTADVAILATQYTKEEDGFGNDQYDKGAAIRLISDAAQLSAALADGGTLLLGTDITIPAEVTEQVFTQSTVLDMNGHTLTINGSLKAAAGTTLTVQGNGTVNGVLYADKGGNLVVDAGEAFEVNSPKSWAVYGALNSTMRINGGTYCSAQEQGSGVIHALGSSLDVRNAKVIVGVDTVTNSKGIHSNAKTTYLENTIVEGAYSTAVNLQNASGSTVIRGGSYTTDYMADGFEPSPTIAYYGSLDIADAQITRIGNGIQYRKSWPAPEKVENLTCVNCKFIPVNGSTYADVDYKR